MAQILIVRPNDDPCAKILYDFAEEIVRALRASGVHDHDDLAGNQARRSRVEAALQASVDCVVFYGHGERDRLFADGTHAANKPAAIDLSNATYLADTIVYAVACTSAANLGPDAVNNHHAKTYIGYDEELFIVCGGVEYWHQRAANVGVLELLLSPNTNCDNAVDRSREVYDDALAYYRTGGGVGHYNSAHALKYLQWDKDHLTLIGDKSASL